MVALTIATGTEFIYAGRAQAVTIKIEGAR